MRFKTILAIIFALAVVVFSLQNSQVTDVRIFFWKLSMSRVLVILGSFAVGVLVGILASVKKKRIFSNIK